ncbi:MAG: hypothetical protein ACJA0Z_001280 [Halioglobus sp.]|jgi:hypothetical protein
MALISSNAGDKGGSGEIIEDGSDTSLACPVLTRGLFCAAGLRSFDTGCSAGTPGVERSSFSTGNRAISKAQLAIVDAKKMIKALYATAVLAPDSALEQTNRH